MYRHPEEIYDKTYYRSFFRQWNEKWPSEASFIFVRTHRRDFRLIFPDELPTTEILRLLRGSVPPPVTDPLHLGLYLRALRRSLKLTLHEVESYTGVAHRYLSSIENERRSVGRKTFKKLELFFQNFARDKVPTASKDFSAPGTGARGRTYIRKFSCKK